MYRVFVYSQICEDAMHTIIEIKLILQKTMHLLYNIIHNILYDCTVHTQLQTYSHSFAICLVHENHK